MSSNKTTKTHPLEVNNNIKKNNINLNDKQLNFDNNYILNNIVWFNPEQPLVLKRQISEKKNLDNTTDKVMIEDLMNYLDTV